MFRFASYFIACVALSGCVADPGDDVSASVSGDQAGATTQKFAALAPDSQPITKVDPSFQAPARAPLPPQRPTPSEARTQSPPNAAEQTATGVTEAPTTTVVPTAAQAYAPVRAFTPAVQGAAPPLPVVQAAFTPTNPARFDASRGGYQYSLPEPRGADEALQMSPRSGAEQTTPRVTAPGEHYYAAYSNTIISCFPQPLREAINTIAEHYGKEVEVTSGLRHNGRRGSYHRKCMAADIRVPGVSPGALAAYSKSIQGINGVGTYRHNNVTHIDIRDYQMSWRY